MGGEKMKKILWSLVGIVGITLLGVTIVIEGKISHNNPWYFYSIIGTVLVGLSGFFIGKND